MTWVSGRCEDGDVKEEKDKEIKGCCVVEGDKQGQGPKWRTKSEVEDKVQSGGEKQTRSRSSEDSVTVVFSKQLSPSPDWGMWQCWESSLACAWRNGP